MPSSSHKRKRIGRSGTAKRKFVRRKPKASNAVSNLVGRSSLIEVKCFDYVYGNSNAYAMPYSSGCLGSDSFLTANATGGMVCINEIVQGSGFYQRVGVKVVTRSIKIEFSLEPGSTGWSTTQNIIARALLVYDKATNGSYPLISDVLASAGKANGSANTGTMGFGSGLNYTNKDRFVVLRNEEYKIDLQNPGVAVKWFLRPRLETVYKSTSTDGSISDISTGGIYLIMFSDDYQSPGYWIAPFNITARIRYYD